MPRHGDKIRPQRLKIHGQCPGGLGGVDDERHPPFPGTSPPAAPRQNIAEHVGNVGKYRRIRPLLQFPPEAGKGVLPVKQPPPRHPDIRPQRSEGGVSRRYAQIRTRSPVLPASRWNGWRYLSHGCSCRVSATCSGRQWNSSAGGFPTGVYRLRRFHCCGIPAPAPDSRRCTLPALLPGTPPAACGRRWRRCPDRSYRQLLQISVRALGINFAQGTPFSRRSSTTGMMSSVLIRRL